MNWSEECGWAMSRTVGLPQVEEESISSRISLRWVGVGGRSGCGGGLDSPGFLSSCQALNAIGF